MSSGVVYSAEGLAGVVEMFPQQQPVSWRCFHNNSRCPLSRFSRLRLECAQGGRKCLLQARAGEASQQCEATVYAYSAC